MTLQPPGSNKTHDRLTAHTANYPETLPHFPSKFLLFLRKGEYLPAIACPAILPSDDLLRPPLRLTLRPYCATVFTNYL